MRHSVLIASALVLIAVGGLLGRLGFSPFGGPPRAVPMDGRIVLVAQPGQISGTLNYTDAYEVVSNHLGQLRACWLQAEDEWQVNGATLTLIVSKTGEVTPNVSSTSHSSRVDECLLQVTGRWSFPESNGVTSVELPMTAYFPARPAPSKRSRF